MLGARDFEGFAGGPGLMKLTADEGSYVFPVGSSVFLASLLCTQKKLRMCFVDPEGSVCIIKLFCCTFQEPW